MGVRQALPWMQEYADRLGVFLTLSTPHLGLWPSSLSPFRRALFWLARCWFPDPMLETLALADARHTEESHLYRLSRDANMGKFDTVVFVYSPEDGRFPHDSTSVSEPAGTCSDADKEGRRCFRSWHAGFACLVVLMIIVHLCFGDVFGIFRRIFRLSKQEHGRTWARIARFGLLGLVLIWQRLRGIFKDASFLTSLRKLPSLFDFRGEV